MSAPLGVCSLVVEDANANATTLPAPVNPDPSPLNDVAVHTPATFKLDATLTFPPLPSTVTAVALLVWSFILPVVPLAHAFNITPSSAAPTDSVSISRPLLPLPPPVPVK